jgi:hypothetical protein
LKDSDKRAAAPDKHKGFYKPYRIKPAEVYVEPNPDVCSGGDKSPR